MAMAPARCHTATGRQLDLYNARDLEGFMDLFTEDIIATDAVTGAILGACANTTALPLAQALPAAGSHAAIRYGVEQHHSAR